MAIECGDGQGERVVGIGWKWAKWEEMGTSISVNNKENSN